MEQLDLEIESGSTLALDSEKALVEIVTPSPEVLEAETHTVEVFTCSYVVSCDEIYISTTFNNIPVWLENEIARVAQTGLDPVATSLNSLISSFNTLEEGYNVSIASLTDSITAQNTKFESLKTETQDAIAGFSSLINSKIDADTAQAQIAQSLVSFKELELTEASAWWQNLINTTATALSAQSNSLSLLQASQNGNSASISTMQTAIATHDSAIAKASQFVTVDVNGTELITGFAMVSSIDPAGEQVSAFGIYADDFKIFTNQGYSNPLTVVGDDIFFNGKVSFNSIPDAPKPATFLDECINAFENWDLVDGDTELTFLNYTGSTGGGSSRIGDNSGNDKAWMVAKERIPFDDTKLYKVTFRVYDAYGTGTTYLGVCGFGSDKITKINIAGADDYSAQYYIALSGSDIGIGWKTYTGYIKGVALTGNGGQSNNIGDPATLMDYSAGVCEKVRYFSPMIIANYPNETGQLIVDNVLVEIIDNPADTINGGTTTINGGKISTNTLDANRLTTNYAWIGGMVQSSGFSAFTSGFRLKANAAGTYSDPTIYGAYIRAGTIAASTVAFGGARFESISGGGHTGQGGHGYSARTAYSASSTPNSYYAYTGYLHGTSYSSGFLKTRILSNDSTVMLFLNAQSHVGNGDVVNAIEYQISGGSWITLSSNTNYLNTLTYPSFAASFSLSLVPANGYVRFRARTTYNATYGAGYISITYVLGN